MAWGLIIDGMYLARVHLDELEEELKQVESNIKYCRERLLMYAAASPRDIVVKDNIESWDDRIYYEINAILDDYAEQCYRRILIIEAMENPSAVSEY